MNEPITYLLAERIKKNQSSLYYALLDFKDKHSDIVISICGYVKSIHEMDKTQLTKLMKAMFDYAINTK